MRRAVDHPLFDEFGAHWAKGVDRDAQRIDLRKRPDVREAEEAFGVGFRFAGETWQDGQAGAEQDKGQLALLHLVHGHDERAEFLLVEVLKLVNKQRHGNVALLGGFGDGQKQVGQVTFQVAAVCSPLFRLDVPRLWGP